MLENLPVELIITILRYLDDESLVTTVSSSRTLWDIGEYDKILRFRVDRMAERTFGHVSFYRDHYHAIFRRRMHLRRLRYGRKWRHPY